MKKVKLIFTALAVLISSTVIAGDNFPVSREFEQSFKKIFPATRTISWENEGKLIVAKFFENGVKHKAYFDANANFLAVSRVITADILPLPVARKLKERYYEFGNISVLEFLTAENRSFYMLNVYYKNKVHIIRAHPDGGFEIVKKIK